ncbi:MAG: hypothetical protein QW794_05260 [Thermosphaera sp.]
MKRSKNDKVEVVAVSLPRELLRFIDEKRGDIPRSRFIRRALELFLGFRRVRGDGREN